MVAFVVWAPGMVVVAGFGRLGCDQDWGCSGVFHVELAAICSPIPLCVM